MATKLGKQEWIVAGLKTLAGEGVDAVRVETLAKSLGVTKGSFYWHFKNREALLKAILKAWKDRATNNVIAEVEAGGGTARVRLRALFAIVLASDGRLDLEVRSWAGKDAGAMRAIRFIDKRRLAYLEALFQELGFFPLEATARATLVYHALIGQFTVGVPGQPRGGLSRQFEIVFEMVARPDAR